MSVAELGDAIVSIVEAIAPLSIVVAATSLAASVVAVYIAVSERIVILRIAAFYLAASFSLGAVTPFITMHPPWLAQLPITLSVLVLLLFFLAIVRS